MVVDHKDWKHPVRERKVHSTQHVRPARGCAGQASTCLGHVGAQPHLLARGARGALADQVAILQSLRVGSSHVKAC